MACHQTLLFSGESGLGGRGGGLLRLAWDKFAAKVCLSWFCSVIFFWLARLRLGPHIAKSLPVPGFS